MIVDTYVSLFYFFFPSFYLFVVFFIITVVVVVGCIRTLAKRLLVSVTHLHFIFIHLAIMFIFLLGCKFVAASTYNSYQ